MSSAALQSAPHQPNSVAALTTHSPSASSNRQYTPSESLNQEGRYASRDQPTASPAPSSRRPSRRPSANSANATIPNSVYQESSQSSPMTSRTALASPQLAAGASKDYDQQSSSRRRHEPPVAPPRTSSTQQGGSSSAGANSRRAARAEERAAQSPRRTPGENSRSSANGQHDGTSSPYDETSTRTKRAASQHVVQEMAHASNSSREHRQTMSTTMPVRTREQQPSTSTWSKQPSREASEVLNRVLVSQPEVDLERERERLGEAQPNSSSARQPATNLDNDNATGSPAVIPMHEAQDESRRGGRSRHDHSKREKSTKFGDYYLGNTIGEGEFGKVKLGWKQDGGVQVAIKLIRRDSVGNNPSRLAKIYREVSILRGLSHPNIVRLHEMSETERHIGIVLEYASGGELFDYILNHRYLKDPAARRLFAQLISGVGYLHKKGIVHRDLKLENLLLDRNRNIIITDFGFANTFDAHDELTEEDELKLSDREFVKRKGLDKTNADGMRRGDLMQTSCGSPCYAAPELVVSDSLYTGRKVDVWSCGVILYAMLAGYLPFDDDPDNPEGDNINLLYKYIVNTPLTFPEYVTPHARDLLRRILVPSPRKRADLFEVARHSWLSEYAHVVEFITSATTTSSEIQNTTVPSDDVEAAGLARSASVREPAKAKTPVSTAVGGLASKQGKLDGEEAAHAKQRKDDKRRTVQVEYVAPTTQTQRGQEPEVHASPRGKTRARSSSRGPTDGHTSSPHDKPLPRDPPVTKDAYTGSPRDARKPPSAHRRDAPPSRANPQRSTDHTYMTTATGAPASRPATGGSMQSVGSRGLNPSSRTSYGQPIPPTIAGTNARGSIQQPKSKNYVISKPIPQETPDIGYGRPSTSINVPPKFAEVSGYGNPAQKPPAEAKGHRRSNTLGEIGGKIFGRSGSIFGGRKNRPEQAEKPSKKYPPISMSNAMPGESRTSMDSRASRRSFSLGLGKKRSGSMTGSQASNEKPPNGRRFSLMKAMGLSKEPTTPTADSSQPDLPIQDPPEPETFEQRYPNQPQSRGNAGQPQTDGMYEQPQDRLRNAPQAGYDSNSAHRRQPSQPSAIPSYLQQGAVLNSDSETSVDRPQRRPPNSAPYQTGYDSDHYDGRQTGTGQGQRVLQKNKRFVDAYDEEEYGRPRDHAGSSGAAKRVMDFFRRRGRARGGEI
ncbi:hypothetical protein GGR57DRAFT_500287 [Xylariaceae sp. FL1272]|nr:hypothetical protein GGR57DRAFT_500287 [Xylariaceae sp. FL1272]